MPWYIGGSTSFKINDNFDNYSLDTAVNLGSRHFPGNEEFLLEFTGLTYSSGKIIGMLDSEIYNLNPENFADDSGDFGLIGNLPNNFLPFGGLTYSPVTNQVLSVSYTRDRLFNVDITNPGNTSSPYGELPRPSGLNIDINPLGLAAHPTEAVVYICSTNQPANKGLWKYDLINHFVSYIGAFPSDIVTSSGAHHDGTNLYVGNANGGIWKINPEDPDSTTSPYGAVVTGLPGATTIPGNGITSLLFVPSTALPDTNPRFSPYIVNFDLVQGEEVSLVMPFAQGGNTPYTYTMRANTAWLSEFEVNGFRVIGRPVTSGKITTNWEATDADGDRATAVINFNIKPVHPVFDVPAISHRIEVGKSVVIELPKASLGAGELTYSMVPDKLPPGFWFADNFTIKGTALYPGTDVLTWQVADEDGRTRCIEVKIRVVASPKSYTARLMHLDKTGTMVVTSHYADDLEIGSYKQTTNLTGDLPKGHWRKSNYNVGNIVKTKLEFRSFNDPEPLFELIQDWMKLHWDGKEYFIQGIFVFGDSIRLRIDHLLSDFPDISGDFTPVFRNNLNFDERDLSSETALRLLPAPTASNANKLVVVNSDGTGYEFLDISGQSGKSIRVNSDSSGFEFFDAQEESDQM